MNTKTSAETSAPSPASKWLHATIVGRTQWTPTLFSLHFTIAAGFAPFVAGQFARVGLPIGDEIVGRPYSLVNPPDQSRYEIYVIEVENGPLSPKLNALCAGDTLYVMPRANGFFSLSEIPAAQTLWCLATGTGLGPFLSMLRTPQPWTQFKNVVLVHGVRASEELTYGAEISAIAAAHPLAFQCVTLASRDQTATQAAHAHHALRGRITTHIATGELERRTGCKLDSTAQIMLCGNPQMVVDAIALLEARGLKKHRKREPGHYTTEAYW
jgi:ferredoxin/flavodoxin---NADP+ reductase